MRHQRPDTSGTSDVEDAVENFAIGIFSRATIASIGAVDGGKERFQSVPLGIRQVGRIAVSVHKMDSTTSLQGLFLNALKIYYRNCGRFV